MQRLTLIRLVLLISISGCTSVPPAATANAPLSAKQIENCHEVGLSLAECQLVADEIDRLRLAGDFSALRKSYEELNPDPNKNLGRCHPIIRITEGSAESCGHLIAIQHDEWRSF